MGCRSPPQPPPGDGVLQGVLGKPFAAGVIAALWPVIWGFCQVFAQVCKRAQVQMTMQHIAQFPAMTQACEALGTLQRVGPQDVQNLVVKMLDSTADQKTKRAALRSLVCLAVD